MTLTAFQNVTKDALLIVPSCTVPTLVAELVLALYDASARAIGHRTDGAGMLETHLDLLGNEAGQGTANCRGGRQLWVLLGLIGPWGGLRLMLLQLWRHAL